MCIFCASIPLAVSVGASLSLKQKEGQDSLSLRNKSKPRVSIPMGKVTASRIVGLIALSLIYHSVLFYRIGL